MVVYADELFLINFMSSYALMYIIGKFVIRTKPIVWRLCVASATGACAAVMLVMCDFPPIAACGARVFSVIIMVFTAFYEQKRPFLRHVLWLIFVSSMLMAAMVMAALLTGATSEILINSGIMYFSLPLRIFMPMLVLSYGGVAVFMRMLQKLRTKKRCAVTITRGGKSITIPALFDSGNLLKEPVSGSCVSVLEWEKARLLLDADCGYDGLLSRAEELKLRAVPYRSIGKRTGIMPAFRADLIEVHGERRSAENTFIGIYDGSLSCNNEYNALLNAAIL